MTRSDGAQSGSKDTKQKVTKQLLERIKEATGADEEVITHTLEQCNYDPNEATARLIENPFSEFVSKSKRKQQRAAESAKDPRIVEVKRAGSMSNSTRGGRGYGRGDRQNGERSRSVRGTARPEPMAKPVIDEGNTGAADGWDDSEAAPVSAPSPSRPLSAASAHQAPQQQEPPRASWGRPGAPGMGTMADLLKRPPPAATAPPPEGQLPPSAPSEKQEIVGSAASSGHIAPPQSQLQDHSLPDSNLGNPSSDAITQPLSSLQSGGGLHTLTSSTAPSSYPNAPQPIGPPSGTVVQSSSSQASTPVHKTSTADLGGVTVDPPVRPSYQPQQDLHTNGGAQHSAWGGLQSKQSPSVTAAMLPNVSLSQQAPFSNPTQHQQPQLRQDNLGPSLLSSLTSQSNNGPSTSDALHSLGNLSTPSLGNNVGSETQSRNSFGQERNQFSGLTQTPQQSADALQMQFGQVQLNGTDYGSGFGTGFGTSSSQNQHHAQNQSHDAAGSLDAELPSYMRQQPSQQQQQQPQSQQPSRSSSEAATSTADALIQQHSRPLGGNTDFTAPSASRAYTAFSQQSAPGRPTQTPNQAPPTSVSAGIQTESTSLGNDSGNYGSYGSAQGMGSFANQHSQYNQAPSQSQYQSYGDTSSGAPASAAAPSSKQPAYDSYSNYNSFAQPSFSQKPDMYGSQAGHAQPQAPTSRYGSQGHTGAAQSSGQGLHQNSPPSAPMQHTSSGPLLSASSSQSTPQLPQMPFAGPGGLPPGMGGGMGQYGYQAQAPAYNPHAYMHHQAGYGYNPMQQSYGGYPQATGAYNSSGFGSNSYQQHAGHHKYQGYGNQGYGGSNGYDDSTGVYGKDRDNMYSNPQHSHGQSHRLPQDTYKSHPYNQGYQQPGHASSYGGPQGQYGMYGQQSHSQGPYHGSSQALNGGSGFGRLP